MSMNFIPEDPCSQYYDHTLLCIYSVHVYHIDLKVFWPQFRPSYKLFSGLGLGFGLEFKLGCRYGSCNLEMNWVWVRVWIPFGKFGFRSGHIMNPT